MDIILRELYALFPLEKKELYAWEGGDEKTVEPSLRLMPCKPF